jgi:GH15 family glucan-1,4-alpha-glucosidase
VAGLSAGNFSSGLTWASEPGALPNQRNRIRIASKRGLPADLGGWTQTRNTIFAWIMERGWSERRQAFVQAEDSDVLDASLLPMPLVPAASPDGLDGAERTFSMCGFWYLECLAFAGRLDEAQLAFEKMLTYANHLGLYSEQIGSSGELLGNFPQAFTHLALISAAIRLDRALQSGRA